MDDLTGFSFPAITDHNLLGFGTLTEFAAPLNVARGIDSLVLQQGIDTADTSGFNTTFEGQFYYETVDEVGDGGGPLNEIYEPEVLIPEGYTADDLIGFEFIIDEWTGELTIIMHFAAEEADSLAAYGLMSDDSGDYLPMSPSGLSDLDAEEGARRTCTVTVTKTVTHNSGSATLNVNIGMAGGTRTSPSTSTTTTTTVTLQGVQVNGRCYIPRG